MKEIRKIFAHKKKAISETTSPDEKTMTENFIGEEIAAAVMALHLYFNNVRDTESEVITIETPSAHYSPWSQKHLVMKRVQRKY